MESYKSPNRYDHNNRNEKFPNFMYTLSRLEKKIKQPFIDFMDKFFSGPSPFPEHPKWDDETLLKAIKNHKIPMRNNDGEIINYTGPNHTKITKNIEELIEDFNKHDHRGDIGQTLMINHIIILQQNLANEGYNDRSEYLWELYTRGNKTQKYSLKEELQYLIILLKELDSESEASAYDKKISLVASYLEDLEHFVPIIRNIYNNQIQAPHV